MTLPQDFADIFSLLLSFNILYLCFFSGDYIPIWACLKIHSVPLNPLWSVVIVPEKHNNKLGIVTVRQLQTSPNKTLLAISPFNPRHCWCTVYRIVYLQFSVIHAAIFMFHG